MSMDIEQKLIELTQGIKEISENQTKTDSQDQKDFMNVIEVSEYLGLRPPTVYSYVNKRQIPHQKVYGRLYFHKPEIIEWVLSNGRMTEEEVKKEGISEFKDIHRDHRA